MYCQCKILWITHIICQFFLCNRQTLTSPVAFTIPTTNALIVLQATKVIITLIMKKVHSMTQLTRCLLDAHKQQCETIFTLHTWFSIDVLCSTWCFFVSCFAHFLSFYCLRMLKSTSVMYVKYGFPGTELKHWISNSSHTPGTVQSTWGPQAFIKMH